MPSIAPVSWPILASIRRTGLAVPKQPAICAARLSTRRNLLESGEREPAESAECLSPGKICFGRFCGIACDASVLPGEAVHCSVNLLNFVRTMPDNGCT